MRRWGHGERQDEMANCLNAQPTVSFPSLVLEGYVGYCRVPLGCKGRDGLGLKPRGCEAAKVAVLR